MYLRAVFAALLMVTSSLTTATAAEAVLLRSGAIVSGTVVTLDEKQLVMETTGADGKPVRRTLALSAVEPTSVYELKARRLPEGQAQTHLDLARWCLDHGVTYFALRELDKARALDPTLAGAQEWIAKARRARALGFYTRAVAAMKSGDDAEAKRLFELLVAEHADTFGGAARSALAFLRRRAAGAPTTPATRAAADTGPRETSGPAPAAPTIAAADRTHLAAWARQSAALAEAAYRAKTDSRSRRLLEQAIAPNEAALRHIDRLQSAGTLTRADRDVLREPFVQAAVRQMLQIAVIYLRQDNEYSANRWITRALILDPDNRRARELRVHIVTEYRDYSRRGRFRR